MTHRFVLRGASSRGGILRRKRAGVVIPVPSILSLSQVYLDGTEATAGAISTITARGSWAQAFPSVTGTAPGTAPNVASADGIVFNGDILRATMTRGPFTKFTMLLEITRNAAPLGSSGVICSINPNGVTGIRMWLRYTTAGYQIVGPNGVTITFAPIGVIGDRQFIAAELDTVAGTLSAIEADGETQTATVATGGISVTRIDIGTSSLVTIHRLSIITE